MSQTGKGVKKPRVGYRGIRNQVKTRAPLVLELKNGGKTRKEQYLSESQIRALLNKPEKLACCYQTKFSDSIRLYVINMEEGEDDDRDGSVGLNYYVEAFVRRADTNFKMTSPPLKNKAEAEILIRYLGMCLEEKMKEITEDPEGMLEIVQAGQAAEHTILPIEY